MEANDRFKVKLLAGLFFAIGAFAWIMYSQIPTGEEIEIPLANFGDEVDSMVIKLLPLPDNKTDFSPKDNYVQLMDLTETERLLNKISDKTADGCKQKIFKRYSIYVLGVSNTILESGNWSPKIMGDLEVNNKIVKGTRFCSESETVACERNIDVVKTYREALSILNARIPYTNIRATATIINRAGEFTKKTELQPCRSLMYNLSNLKNTLFKSHVYQVKRVVANKINTANTMEMLENTSVIIDKFVNNALIYGKSSSNVKRLFGREYSMIRNKQDYLSLKKEKQFDD